MKKRHIVFKNIFQIFLLILEISIVTSIFLFITKLFRNVEDTFDIIERCLLGIALYEIIVYFTLSSINDSRKDSYLALKTNYELALLYCDTNMTYIKDLILNNIDKQLSSSYMNGIKIRQEYEIMKELIKKKDKNQIQVKTVLYTNLFEAEELKWKHSFLLLLLK